MVPEAADVPRRRAQGHRQLRRHPAWRRPPAGGTGNIILRLRARTRRGPRAPAPDDVEKASTFSQDGVPRRDIRSAFSCRLQQRALADRRGTRCRSPIGHRPFARLHCSAPSRFLNSGEPRPRRPQAAARARRHHPPAYALVRRLLLASGTSSSTTPTDERFAASRRRSHGSCRSVICALMRRTEFDLDPGDTQLVRDAGCGVQGPRDQRHPLGFGEDVDPVRLGRPINSLFEQGRLGNRLRGALRRSLASAWSPLGFNDISLERVRVSTWGGYGGAARRPLLATQGTSERGAAARTSRSSSRRRTQHRRRCAGLVIAVLGLEEQPRRHPARRRSSGATDRACASPATSRAAMPRRRRPDARHAGPVRDALLNRCSKGSALMNRVSRTAAAFVSLCLLGSMQGCSLLFVQQVPPPRLWRERGPDPLHDEPRGAHRRLDPHGHESGLRGLRGQPEQRLEQGDVHRGRLARRESLDVVGDLRLPQHGRVRGGAGGGGGGRGGLRGAPDRAVVSPEAAGSVDRSSTAPAGSRPV